MKFRKKRYLFDEEILNAFNDNEEQIKDDMPTNSIVFSLEKGSGSYQVPEKFKNVDVKKVFKELKINKQILGKFNGVKETSYAILGNKISENLWSLLMATKQESVMYVGKNFKAEFWKLKGSETPEYTKIGGGNLKEVEGEPNDDFSKVDGKFYIIDERIFELVDVFYDEIEEEENMELTKEELKVLKGLIAFIKNFNKESTNEEELVDEENNTKFFYIDHQFFGFFLKIY